MESHKIWIANLNDLLTNHICQGLIKTYTEIHRLCGGHKLKLSIQTAMEGIAHLSTHKLNADYKVLLDSLIRIGYNETNLNDLVNNAYSSYALSALRSAGIKCDRLDTGLLNGPKKSAFIHEVYINVARHIWTRPDVLIEQNIPQLKMYVRDSVEQAVRSGVNLNFIIDALATGSTVPAQVATPSLTIKERLSNLNGGKSILDDDSDDGVSEDEVITKPSVNRSRNVIPDAPSILGEMTIENDDLAPDNMTITTDSALTSTLNSTLNSTLTLTRKTTDASLQVNKSNQSSDDMIINVTTRGVPFELSENSSNYTVTDEDEDEDGEYDEEDDDEDKDTDEETEVTLQRGSGAGSGAGTGSGSGAGGEGSVYTVYSDKTVKSLKSTKSLKTAPPSRDVNMLDDSESIPSFFVAGKIDPQNIRSVKVDTRPTNEKKNKTTHDSTSAYSVTLLSHRDMLSSRLSRLGL